MWPSSTTFFRGSSSSSSSVYGEHEDLQLPLGFRFNPTPCELICYYVIIKNFDLPLPIHIPEVDLYERHPKSLSGDFKYPTPNNEKYYFTKRKLKNQGGSRVKRAMDEGVWKTTGVDEEIRDCNNVKIGYKKRFTFYEGKKKPTKWIMHEFRDLSTDSVTDALTATETCSGINRYVLCMIYENVKKSSTNSPTSAQAMNNERSTYMAATIKENVASPIPHSIYMSDESLDDDNSLTNWYVPELGQNPLEFLQ